MAKSEEVTADGSQQVANTALTGVEAYDTSYSSAAAAAYSATASAYSYAAPSQNQWAAYSAYSAAHPVRLPLIRHTVELWTIEWKVAGLNHKPDQ